MKIKFIYILFTSFLILSGVSCSSSKTIRFEPITDAAILMSYKSQNQHVPIFEKNDIIEITQGRFDIVWGTINEKEFP